MTSLKKRSAVILFFLLIGIIGYSQIQSASQISVDLSENTIINENQNETDYEIKLKFENPSLLTLPAGKTEFFVSYDDEVVGKGNLESFTLYPLSTSLVEGTFTTNTSSDESKSIKISGIISGKVFRQIDRSNKILDSLSDRAVALILKWRAEKAGIKSIKLAGHSMRSGIATSLAKEGATENEIKKITNHRSSQMVQRYIQDAEIFDNATKLLDL